MFDIIVNPTAGKGMAKHILEIVEKTFQEKGIEYLKDIAKLNFKNTKKIEDKLKESI